MDKEVINCFYEYFKDSPKKLKIVCDWDEVIQSLEPFALYLALKKTRSTLPGLEKLTNIVSNSDFQQRVYELCSQIPTGKVSTYKIIAQFTYGSSNYARWVGILLSRCPGCKLVLDSKNYDCPKIHCYRVIKSDFRVGGFLGESGKNHEKVTVEKLTSEGLFFNEKGYLAKDRREKAFFKDFKESEFSLFFETFWQNSLIDYSRYGSKLNKNFPEQISQKNTSDFYNSAPFLSLAKELLMLVKKKKVEVIFLSAYDKRFFSNGDPRKKKIFAETFSKMSGCSLNLVGFGSEKIGKTKGEWIRENVPDCDIILDDNPKILTETLEKNEKIIACSPFYPATKHHSKVLLIKTSISNLKKEDF